jgi:hypothetical protein
VLAQPAVQGSSETFCNCMQGQRAMLFPAERPRAQPTAPPQPLVPCLPARATAAIAPTSSTFDTVSLLLPDYPGVLHDDKVRPAGWRRSKA